MKKQTLSLHSFSTAFGLVRIAATSKGVVLIGLPGESERSFRSSLRSLFGDFTETQGNSITREAQRQLAAYFRGRLQKFSLPLDLRGTPFQKKVLRRVARIGYGKTMQYGEMAEAIGHPGAARAVGSANGSNHLPIVIPCHRVVASNGLGGYGGGLALKRRLLRLEGAL